MSVIKVKVIDQTLTITDTPMIASGDVKEDSIKFEFDDTWTGYGKTAVFYRDDSKEDVYQVALNRHNTAVVPYEVAKRDGIVWFGVVGVINGTDIVKTSEVIWYELRNGFYSSALASTSAEASTYKRILQVVEEIKAAVGSPLVAAKAEDMTDKNRVYVYVGEVGEETGYTAGDWYYWDGTEWTSGGTYNSVALETDDTLSIADMAADAATVGEKAMLYRGTLTKDDDINSLDFCVPGLWLLNTIETVDGEPKYPTGWPSGAGKGRLVTFGNYSTQTTAYKAQMVFEHGTNKAFLRIGRTSGDPPWEDWTEIATHADKNSMIHLGLLTGDNNIDNAEFRRAGMWTCPTQVTPTGWPNKADGTPVGSGKLVCFGADSTNMGYKAQMVLPQSGDAIYFRTSTSVGTPRWNDWHQIANYEDAYNGDIVRYRRAIGNGDNINLPEFYESGMWYKLGDTTVEGWPEGVGIGRLICFGTKDGSSPRYKAQIVISRDNKMYYRGGRDPAEYEGSEMTASGWNDWETVIGTEDRNNLYYRGTIVGDVVENDVVVSEGADIDSQKFFQAGMWTWNGGSKPTGWPEEAGQGKLICFGADGNNAAFKAQMIFTNYGGDIFYRVNAAAKWKKLADDNAMTHKGLLTSNDHIDGDVKGSEKFLSPGMWTVNSASDYPADWPRDLKVGLGKFICFGSDNTSTNAYKVQAIITRSYNQMLYRIGRGSSGWSFWKRVGTHGSGRKSGYVAMGASTTEGRTGQGGRQIYTYPRFVWYMGGFSEMTTLAKGGTGVINRKGITPYSKANHVITDAVRISYNVSDEDISRSVNIQGVKHYVVKSAAVDNYNFAAGDIRDGVTTDNVSIQYNFMDAVTDPANIKAFENADLITINYAHNDRTIKGTGGYNIIDDENYHNFAAAFDKMIGSADDYFSYDRATYWSDDPVERAGTAITLNEKCLNAEDGCTVAGCWNFVLRYLAVNYPKAQVVLCKPVSTWVHLKDISVDETTHKIKYVERNSEYYYKYYAFLNNFAVVQTGLNTTAEDVLDIVADYISAPESFDAATVISGHSGATITAEDLTNAMAVIGGANYGHYLDLCRQSREIKPLADLLGVNNNDLLKIISYRTTSPTSEFAKELSSSTVPEFVPGEGWEDDTDGEGDVEPDPDDVPDEGDPPAGGDLSGGVVYPPSSSEYGAYDLNNPVFRISETWIASDASDLPDNWPNVENIAGTGKLVIFGKTESSQQSQVMQVVFSDTDGYIFARAFNGSAFGSWQRIDEILDSILDKLTYINPRLPNIWDIADERDDCRFAYANILYAEKSDAVLEQIAENLNIPIADPSRSYNTPWHAIKEKYGGSIHPNRTGYLNYNRAIAAAVLSKFAN